MSNSLGSHGWQHARLRWPSLSSRVCSNSCPLIWWCHPNILSSVAPFSSCPQSFPVLGSFPVSWLLESGGQSPEASAPASILPMNIQGWFPLGLTGLVSLLPKRLSRVFSSMLSIYLINMLHTHYVFKMILHFPDEIMKENKISVN